MHCSAALSIRQAASCGVSIDYLWKARFAISWVSLVPLRVEVYCLLKVINCGDLCRLSHPGGGADHH